LAKAEKEIIELWESSSLPKAERDKHIRRAVSESNRKIRSESNDERWQLIKRVVAMEAAVNPVKDLYGSPENILAVHGLASPERAAAQAQVDGLAIHQLRAAGQVAIQKNDRNLASAIVQRLQSLPEKQRRLAGLTAGELSRALCGPQYERSQEAIGMVREGMNRALAQNRTHEQQTGSILARIQAGLAAQKLRAKCDGRERYSE